MALTTVTPSGVAHVSLDRPNALNALTVDLLERLDHALDDAESGGAQALVISGEGRAFCAGADLALVRAALDGDAPTVLAPLVDALHGVIRHMRRLPFPVVAAVEGPAVGAGMGLALAADLRVVARSARFVPGYLAIGASPDGGVSYLLARALGAARATSLLLRGRSLDAATLAEFGLVEEVADDGQALDAARKLAESLSTTAPLALVRLRRLLDLATRQDLSDQLDAERQLVSELWATADFREGVTAFLEKRPAQFTGA